MKEIFRDIPNYEGYYQVSNLGNVKSLERKVIHSNNRVQKYKGCFKKQHVSSVGYLTVSLWKNNKDKKYSVHQLVAMAFLNHKPCGFKLVCDHINNDKLDNRAENLQLISNRLNSSKDKKKVSSNYIGVHWHKRVKKWVSNIRINKKKKFLGSFDNEYDAHLAYQNELKLINNGK